MEGNFPIQEMNLNVWYTTFRELQYEPCIASIEAQEFDVLKLGQNRKLVTSRKGDLTG